MPRACRTAQRARTSTCFCSASRRGIFMTGRRSKTPASPNRPWSPPTGASTYDSVRHDKGTLRNWTTLPETRNARTVWRIASESTSFAHFATFPQALVRRCLLGRGGRRRCVRRAARPIAGSWNASACSMASPLPRRPSVHRPSPTVWRPMALGIHATARRPRTMASPPPAPVPLARSPQRFLIRSRDRVPLASLRGS